MDTQTQNYQVIPRKFRPQTFEAVVGQEPIVTTLKNALKFNRLAHAYLFCGCRGTGKTTLARVFAKALNCHKLSEQLEPCNTSTSCLEIMSGRSLDVLEIDGASNRGIDDMRQINETIGYAPASGKYKIYIIDEVHMLTKEAFNALLKTLEEPPSHVKFFFATTEPHKVLPTIISRCQRFDLKRITQLCMEQKLHRIAQELGITCEKEALSLLAHLSEGSLRDAESLLDQVICYAEQPIRAESVSHTLGLMPKESFFALDRAIIEGQPSFAFDLSHTLFSSGKDFSYFLDHLLEHFRTLLLVKFDQPCFFLTPAHQEHYTRIAPLYTEEHCLYILDYLIQWQQQITRSPFKRMGLEMILLHLIRSKNRVSFSSMVKKLSEIQSHLNTVQKTVHPAATPTDSISEKTFASLSEERNLGSSEVTAPQQQPDSIALSTRHPLESVQESPSTPLLSAQDSPPPTRSVEEMLLSQVQDKPFDDRLQDEKKISPPSSRVETGTQETPHSEERVLEEATKEEKEKPPLSTPHAFAGRNVQSRYETLIRFASVELEGIIKN